MRIAMVAAEAAPYAKTGGLADVLGALPRALAKRGHSVVVFLPRYRSVDPVRHGLRREERQLWIAAGEEAHEVSFYRGAMGPEGAEIVAIDIPALFDRDGLYGAPGADYPDNAERFIALARASLEYLRVSEWHPDVLHAHDWHAGLVPVYARETYRDDPGVGDAASIFTVHNMAYQGTFDRAVLRDAELSDSLFRPGMLDHFGSVSYLQAGIRCADAVTTVSPRYAQEVLESDAFGRGMQFVLRERLADFHGILNGIDVDTWNPAADPHLPIPYSAADTSGKVAAREALQRGLSLAVDPGAFLVGVVSRLDGQKGLDLLLEAVPDLVADGCQLALLGSGDPALEMAFREAAARHPGRVGVGIGFDEPLAHRIYSGADAFAMPSRFEPCGLGQMIALRYGTVPIVRETGGLADTVRDADADAQGNGFTFLEETSAGLLAALRRAAAAKRDGPRWQGLVSRGMNEDHSWHAAAERYEELYQFTVRSTRRERKKGRTA